jgi:hypothetical protein
MLNGAFINIPSWTCWVFVKIKCMQLVSVETLCLKVNFLTRRIYGRVVNFLKSNERWYKLNITIPLFTLARALNENPFERATILGEQLYNFTTLIFIEEAKGRTRHQVAGCARNKVFCQVASGVTKLKRGPCLAYFCIPRSAQHSSESERALSMRLRLIMNGSPLAWVLKNAISHEFHALIAIHYFSCQHSPFAVPRYFIAIISLQRVCKGERKIVANSCAANSKKICTASQHKNAFMKFLCVPSCHRRWLICLTHSAR